MMKKTIIAFDTNIWIYLATPKYSSFFEEIRHGQEEGSFHIIVNDIIKLEWKRNKQTTINKLAKNIKDESIYAKNLANYIYNEDLRNKYLEILSQYKSEQDRIKAAEKAVEKVEQLMNQCECSITTDDEKLFIANLAINGLPPMQNSKNNFNDALIIRNLCLYVQGVIRNESNAVPYKYDFIYVSNNSKDFINPDTNNIYDTITKDIDQFRILNVTDLPKALHFSKEFIDEFDEWLECALESYISLQMDIARGK